MGPLAHSLLIPYTLKFLGASSGWKMVEFGPTGIFWHGLELLQGSWNQSIPSDAIMNFNSEPDVWPHSRCAINTSTVFWTLSADSSDAEDSHLGGSQ